MSALNDKALLPAGALAAGHRLDRYEILAKLASGGMAIVYVANASGAAGFERLVALKVLHANLAYEDEFIRMFLDEARLAARIRHPHVVSTIDISDSIETGFFLVMEYIEGDHLGALLSSAHKAGMRIGLPIIFRIIADALAGLGAAHDLRDDAGRPLHLVHRDVSPHNVLVGCDGVARLTDFGVAKAEDRLTHTRDGQIKGKLAYMAPEQASNGVSDQRSDLFSMGIILWECVTGRRLFRAENTAATLHKLLSEEIALPSAIDPALAPLDSVLRRALERDPNARFQSADEFIEAIETVARTAFTMAPRRAVSEAVRLHAAVKLAREHALIGSAKRALLAGDKPAAEGGESGSGAEVSLTSLSRSKPSGVFSNRTAPGLLRRGRSSRPPTARTLRLPEQYRVLLAATAPPTPPPPLGAVLENQVPEAPHDRAQPVSHRSSTFAVLVCVVAVLALGGTYVRTTWIEKTRVAPRPRSLPALVVSSVVHEAPQVASPAPISAPVPETAVIEPAIVAPASTATDVSMSASSRAGVSETDEVSAIGAKRGTRVRAESSRNPRRIVAPVVQQPPQDLLPNPYAP